MADLHWDTTLFSQLYSAIQSHGDYSDLFTLLKDDLVNLYVVEKQNNSSRTSLESKKLTVADQTFELNQDFVLIALELASELNIDEVVAAKVVLHAKSFQDTNNLTTSILDTARIAYYKRIETVLYVFSYFINTGSKDELTALFGGSDAKNFIIDKLLLSFKHIEEELNNIHESIRETKILQPNLLSSVEFKARINFRRNNLFRCHQLLGEIFYILVPNEHISFVNNTQFKQILSHVTENFVDNDSFVLHYLPGLYNYLIYINKSVERGLVKELYEFFNSQITTANIESTLLKHPIKSTVLLFFYSFMSNWIQGESFTLEEQQRNFEQYFDVIQVAIIKLFKIGALEQLMAIVSEVFSVENQNQHLLNHVQFYDLQSLLQRHIPKLYPKRVLDIDEEKTKQLQELISAPNSSNFIHQESNTSDTELPKIYLDSNLNLTTSSNFKFIFHVIFDDFLLLFLNNFPNILVGICDSEEDFYLTNIKDSSEANLTIDDLAENAELERFYMIMYHNFTNRPKGSLTIWSDSEDGLIPNETIANFIEFLDWGMSKTTNSLIKSCFVLVLSALMENELNSLHVYEFLNIDDSSEDNSVKAIENGNGWYASKLLLDDSSRLSTAKSSTQTGSSVVTSGTLSSGKDIKLSWNTILRALHAHNISFQQNYDKFISKFQNSYNQLFLPSSSMQTFQTFFNVGEPSGAAASANLKNKDNDIKLEDLELSEEEIIELSSYFKLIYCASLNNEKVKQLFYEKNNFELLDSLFEFLNNLTNIASLKTTFAPRAADENGSSAGNLKSETFLIGLILSVIKALVPGVSNFETIKIKHKIWNMLDEWLFKNKLSTVTNRNLRNPSFKNFFSNIFLEFNGALGFMSLFDVLVSPPADEKSNGFYLSNNINGDKFTLPYPKNLGIKYRKSGLWPYFDYFLNDVFASLTSEALDASRKNCLISVSLKIILNSFKYFNPLLTLSFRSAGISNLDSVVEGNDFLQFIKENPASIVMNYVYKSNIRNVLFKAISTGNDEILDKLAQDPNVQIVRLSLSVLLRILKFEDTYTDIVIPTIKALQAPNEKASLLFYLPQAIGTHDVKTFYNALSFDLPVIGHLGLYVSSKFPSISFISIDLLNLISKSSQFLVPSNSATSSKLPLIRRNRLFTIFETIDESTRIRLAFINQLESDYQSLEDDNDIDYYPNDDEDEALHTRLVSENLILKVKLLNFVDRTLEECSSVNVAHFLLGFEVSSFNELSIGNKDTLGTVASSRSLLSSLVTTFLEALEEYKSTKNISYAPIRIASLTLSIILKLCKKPLTSNLTLQYLEKQYSFFEALVAYEPIIDLTHVKFSNELFNNNFRDLYHNSFTSGSKAIGGLLEFFHNRGQLLQYLSIEFSRISNQGSLLKLDAAMRLLISNNYNSAAHNTPEILSLLDILDFNIQYIPDVESVASSLRFFSGLNLGDFFSDSFFGKSDSCTDVWTHSKNKDSLDSIYGLQNFEFILNLRLKQLSAEGVYVSDKALQNNKLHVHYWKGLEHKAKKQQKENTQQHKLLASLNNADSESNSELANLGSPPKELSFSNQNEVLKEIDLLKRFFVNLKASVEFKHEQLQGLHSWVQFVQLIALDDKISDIVKINFILQIFDLIIPKIDTYYEYDISISKEFIALSINLLEVYIYAVGNLKDKGSDLTTFYDKLFSLFQVCLRGILNKFLDSGLRSDLYSLANKYLLWVMEDKVYFKKMLHAIKIGSDRLLPRICSDVENGDDSNRVTSLVLLETFCRLSNQSKANFVVEHLVQNNILVSLVRSIKRTDDLLCLTKRKRQTREDLSNTLQSEAEINPGATGVTLDSFLYELTAFKAALYLLIRISETKTGSGHLLQCDVLKIFGSLLLLEIDPDLGLTIVLDEYNIDSSNSFVSIELSLDKPLALGGGENSLSNRGAEPSSSTKVSLFELLVPIFQLITAILVSMGPSNRNLIDKVKDLLVKHNRLFIGVLKREKLLEKTAADRKCGKAGGSDIVEDGESNAADAYEKDDISYLGLQKLSELLLLLSALTEYKGNY